MNIKINNDSVLLLPAEIFKFKKCEITIDEFINEIIANTKEFKDIVKEALKKVAHQEYMRLMYFIFGEDDYCKKTKKEDQQVFSKWPPLEEKWKEINK